MSLWPQNEKSVILIRQQFKQLFDHSSQNEPLRNQLLIDFPTQMGMRPLEIELLGWEDVDIRSGQIMIQDSKNKQIYPIPLSYQIAEKLERYREGCREGPVIRRLRGAAYAHQLHGKPLHRETIWRIWGGIAMRARLKKPEIYNPRLGRHYFAAMWNKRGGNLEVLRRILGHGSLEYTQVYLSRLIFFEDVKQEYERIQEVPAIPKPIEYHDFCYDCESFQVCRFKDEFAGLKAATGCKYFKERRPEFPVFEGTLKPRRVRKHRGEIYYGPRP